MTSMLAVSARKPVFTLAGLFLVQFQAVASGLLPTLPGVPTTVAEWATFAAYFVLTIAAHIPKIKQWFAARPAPVGEVSSVPSPSKDEESNADNGPTG